MQSLIEKDVYWGEFSEGDMDHLLDLLSRNHYEEARTYIDVELHRTDFIFGVARSDFLYALPLTKDSVCLDIGCGLGVHTFNMAPLVKEVHAVDLSKKRVQFCEYRKKFEHVSNVSLYHTDVDHLPFPDNHFDIIVMNGVVEWLGERNVHNDPREDQIEVLKKIHSLLKKGGSLYIGIENRFALTYLHNAKDHNRLKYTTFMPRWLANFVTQRATGHSYRTYTYSKSGYNCLLQESGFDTSMVTFFVAHPGYNLPQYLIDFDDLSAFRFFLISLYGNRSYGLIIKFLGQQGWFLRTIRYFFYSYAMFVKKV